MFQNLGNGWITRSDGIGGTAPHRYGGFGERNDHKPRKTVIGIVILIVLSIVLYGLRAAG